MTAKAAVAKRVGAAVVAAGLALAGQGGAGSGGAVKVFGADIAIKAGTAAGQICFGGAYAVFLAAPEKTAERAAVFGIAGCFVKVVTIDRANAVQTVVTNALACFSAGCSGSNCGADVVSAAQIV